MTDDNKEPLIDKYKNKEKNKKLSKKYSEDNIEEEEEENELSNFIEKEKKEKKVDKKIVLKNHTISKIYFLFFIQLSITCIFIYYAFNNQVFNNLLKKNKKLFSLSIALTAIIFFSSYKWEVILITVPFNYFFFLVFTLSISFIICKIVIIFEFKTIMVFWVLTLIMILSLSTYAYNSTKEIQIIEAVIFASLFLTSFSIIIKFVAKIHIMSILLMLLCLISLAMYLIYDVKSLIKEKKIDYNYKHYILVNISLYTDIFKHILKFIKYITTIIGKSMSDDEKNGNSIFNDLKDVNDEIEKGFKEFKNIGKDDSDDDEDEDDKKSKGKKKKNKKGKKEEKNKKDNKGKKNDKGKKDDKGKKGKKDKKDKKEDKKDKKGKKDKGKKYKDDDDDLFNEENTDNIGKMAGQFFADILGQK